MRVRQALPRTTQRQRRRAGLRLFTVFALALSAMVGGVLQAPTTTSAKDALTLIPAITGLDASIGVTHAGDGSQRLFVIERPGRIRIVVDGKLQAVPFLDLTNRVHTDDSEQGLLALAFHPDYEHNGELFVLYTALDWSNTVERFHVSSNPNRADAASGEIVLAIPDRAPNHNGGSLAFGPDGMFYISTGDEGGASDQYQNAQSLSALFGKILRIDVDHGDAYAIPADNPFADVSADRPEIWGYGLRNPWRISFDRLTGDLWIADVGQATWEEVNVVPAGSDAGVNFGWNQMEGMHCYTEGCDPNLYRLPVAEYTHAQGCSITGGYVYRGSSYPSLVGRYLFGDYCSGRIWSLTRSGDDWQMALELDTDLNISSFGEDEAGELYLVDLSGTIYQVTTSATTEPVIDIPAFQRTWARTDGPVADLVVDRTWMWGPDPITPAIPEPYAQSPSGTRTVQYFDKSRMEISHPDAPDDGIWYVTNGLLVIEMVEGYYQTGDTQRDDTPSPADISIAGDLGQGPTYAYINNYQLRAAPARAEGTDIDQVAVDDGLRDAGSNELPENVKVTRRVTVDGIDHTIASVFWDFMTSNGFIDDEGQIVNGPLFENPYYATGYPITEAYWSPVSVKGAEQTVLWQCFERRCLTYTPGNPDGWKVEAGNVGLHYYLWRYGEQP